MKNMIQKAFLNTENICDDSYIFTKLFLDCRYEITISDCNNKIHLSSNLYYNINTLNTFVDIFTNLRDTYIFLEENREKIIKNYRSKEEAQQFLNYLKEKYSNFFENYTIKTRNIRKETLYYIGNQIDDDNLIFCD